ncbi:MAG: hypothetical protein H6620_12065 [Halobacteriovoraceae bacterium]|nr:hypothetical protein [Halobacteriovoraceae bacterium]
MSKRFEDILKQKLKQDLPKDFDQRFWKSFEQMQISREVHSWKTWFDLKWIAPLAACLILGVYLMQNSQNTHISSVDDGAWDTAVDVDEEVLNLSEEDLDKLLSYDLSGEEGA